MTVRTTIPSTPATTAPAIRSDRPFEATDYLLYVLTVVSWSASWFAIALQVGTVPNEVNLVWRFGLATVLMFAWVAFSRRRLRFALSDHLRFAALGMLMFSTNFMFFYYGAGYLVSGLMSVVFSLASVVNLALGALIMREKPIRPPASTRPDGFSRMTSAPSARLTTEASEKTTDIRPDTR